MQHSLSVLVFHDYYVCIHEWILCMCRHVLTNQKIPMPGIENMIGDIFVKSNFYELQTHNKLLVMLPPWQMMD